jgi:hypothetical protein
VSETEAENMSKKLAPTSTVLDTLLLKPLDVDHCWDEPLLLAALSWSRLSVLMFREVAMLVHVG